jgi:hypothetical protein
MLVLLYCISFAVAADMQPSSDCSDGVCMHDVDKVASTGGLMMLQAKTKLHDKTANLELARDISQQASQKVMCKCLNPGRAMPLNGYECSNGKKGYGSPEYLCSLAEEWPLWKNSTELYRIFKKVPHKICGNQALREGFKLFTPGGYKAELKVQKDGNVVLYRKGGRVLWSTNKFPGAGAKLVMQDDCNLAVYDKHGKAHWDLKTDQSFLDRVKQISEEVVSTAKKTIDTVKQIKGVDDVISAGKEIHDDIKEKTSGDSTYCPDGARDANVCFVLQSDCNLVIYSSESRQALWDSKTTCGPTR